MQNAYTNSNVLTTSNIYHGLSRTHWYNSVLRQIVCTVRNGHTQREGKLGV